MTLSYENSFENCAIYLPAISFGYAKFAHNGTFSRPLPFTAQDLNFLAPKTALFHYPWALFSAGQAAKSIKENDPPTMVSERDRNRTIVVGDSGGFQVQGDTIKFRGPATVRRMMRWLEAQTDYSMVLDFPTGGIKSGQIAKHTARLRSEGHGDLLDQAAQFNRQAADFNAALVQTSLNNQQFVVERTPGATKFLNVLQGRTDAESKAWYEHVKHYPFEGWAFAGGNRTDFSLLLQRLIDLRDDGILENMPWLHILGVSELDLACLYTVVQRAVRRHINPTLQISLDSASPYKTASVYEAYAGCILDKSGWSMVGVNMSKRSETGITASRIGSTEKFTDYLASCPIQSKGRRRRERRFDTVISHIIRVGDICVDPSTKSSLDQVSNYLMQNHNVEAMVAAMRMAHAAFFDPTEIRIPAKAQIVRQIIDMVFTSDQPEKFIKECREALMEVT